jgi:hypothetical protein
MKPNRAIFIPAISVAIVSILLIIYYYNAAAHGAPANLPSGALPPGGSGTRPRPPEGEGADPFKFLGTLAIICGAISFSWFRLKKKLASPSRPIKKLAKIMYAAHTYTGWIALILIVIHGAYYLITKLNDPSIFSGLAAFLLLLALAIYGWLMKRKPNKQMRKMHFLLSNLWLLALLVHAGGNFILVVAVTLMIWAIIWIIELAAKRAVVQ